MQRLYADILFLVRRGFATPHQKGNMGGGLRPPPAPPPQRSLVGGRMASTCGRFMSKRYYNIITVLYPYASVVAQSSNVITNEQS